MVKIRLDQLLVERGLADSPATAQRLVLAGRVVVDDHRIDKPGYPVPADALLRLKGEVCRYVSRGGLKLEGALARFGLLDLTGRTGLDVGASTGGFTDCLLAHGCPRVWAVDTGRGQFHARLRDDPRVRLREQANARNLTPEWFGGERMDIVAVDVSFISLRRVLPPLAAVLTAQGETLALVKPQFEAAAAEVGEGGVVRERSIHRRVLDGMIAFARADGWTVEGLCPSPLPGPAGNVEFFLRLTRAEAGKTPPPAADLAIEQVLDEAYTLSNSPGGMNAADAGAAAQPGEKDPQP